MCNNAVEVIKLLLAADPTSLEKKDGVGQTPLLRACASKSAEAALLLIERGAAKSWMTSDGYGLCPLAYARLHGMAGVEAALCS